MLASKLSRRVSQHIFAAESLLNSARNQANGAGAETLMLTSCLLQLELAMSFYLHELSGSRSKNIQVEALNFATLETQLQRIDSDSARDLLNSAADAEAPVAILVNQLNLVRLCKNQDDAIQSPMFASDATESIESVETLKIIASSQNGLPEQWENLLSLSELEVLIVKLKTMIERHRNQAQEY